MGVGSVNINGNEIIIRGRRAKLRNRFFLILLFTAVSIAIFELIFSIYVGNRSFSIQYTILLLLYLGVGYMAFRFYLWHSFGKEVLMLYPDRIEYYVDFKFFKGNKKLLRVDNLKDTFGIRLNIMGEKIRPKSNSHNESKENPTVTPISNEKETFFSESNEVIETIATISPSEMEEIQTKFLELYG